MKIECVPIKAAHIEEVLSMMIDFYAIDDYPIDRDKSTALFHEFIQNSELGQCFIILNEEKEVCGYIIYVSIFSFEMGGRVMLLDELYVKKEYQGKGIGRSALEFVKKIAIENNFKRIVLEVEPHNSRAITLYESERFKKHKRFLMINKVQ